jgi:hypothetical protein
VNYPIPFYFFFNISRGNIRISKWRHRRGINVDGFNLIALQHLPPNEIYVAGYVIQSKHYSARCGQNAEICRTV